MGPNNKRKRGRGPLIDQSSSDIAIADTLSRLQGSPDSEPISPNSAQNGGDPTNRTAKKKRVDGEKTKYPTLSHIEGRLQSPIRIADLQGLLLYCFADGIAPQWISLKHSGHMRRAVALMVPGLEMGMFDGKIPLDAVPSETQANLETPMTTEGTEQSPEERKAADFENWKQGLPLEDRSQKFNPQRLDPTLLPESLRPLSTMFPHIWPVRAPGDGKFNKVHSPIQAMLSTPVAKNKKEGPTKGARPVRTDKSFVPKRTPITAFIANSEQLRENDYILHPAFFTSEDEKASEAAIRVRNKQSAEDGWVDTLVQNLEDGEPPESEIEQGSMSAGRQVLSIDCEMCLTEGGQSELARISIVNWDGDVVLDELVKPPRPVKDYLTQFSGITEEMLAPVTTTLPDIQKRLLSIITPRTVLVGHSLNSDMAVLKMVHPFIVDTGVIYPHARGPPLKCALRFLTQKFLGKEIQKGKNGHDSIEDARAVLDLVKLKCEKGERWGTSDATNESVFRRLGRSSGPGKAAVPGEGRTGAVVDWGSPERGYGAQATTSIGCRDDDDIVKGVSSAINGDESTPSIPGGGVDFVWARLRDLELHRGWCTRIPDSNNADASTTLDPPEEATPATPAALAETVSRTVSRIAQIYESLPPCTLFMVYSGTGDPREIARLQDMYKTHRAEFVHGGKPWDELTVKWTDTEQQALKSACEKAREGCGFLCVK